MGFELRRDPRAEAAQVLEDPLLAGVRRPEQREKHVEGAGQEGRRPVLVHEFLDGTLGVSFQGRLLARFDRAGQFLRKGVPPAKAA